MAPVASAQQPDLIIGTVNTSSASTDGQSLTISGSVDVQVQNVGSATTGASCTLIVFEDADRDGAYDAGFDPLLGTDTIPALAASGVHVESVALSGTVAFPGNRVSAWVDSSGTIAESRETNNVGDSGQSCAAPASTGVFSANAKWHWLPGAGDPYPNHANVLSAPCVVDLDRDGSPEVVFTATDSTAGSPHIIPGVLRAIRGDTGADVWVSGAVGVSATSNIAVGDLDGDGYAEIVATESQGTGNHVVCFDRFGAHQWTSGATESLAWDALAIVNLDQSGPPEILARRSVLTSFGAVLWQGTGGWGGTGVGGTPIAADVDANGSIDVVAGDTIYSAAGAILYSNAALPNAFCAVGNFDLDAAAEIVHSSSAGVRLLEHDLSVKWGPTALPGAGGNGAPPTIADFDGDGAAEIAVAGRDRISVFETNGAVKWSAVIQDLSSSLTPLTAYDFDGDGAAELVFRSEIRLHVFRGTDGATLFETPLSSCTWLDMPVVADIDADGDAEIVCPANNNCNVAFGNYRGVHAFEGPGDAWQPTRRIWNQHTYHITNVAEDGAIPLSEPRPWQTPALAPYNSMRQNAVLPLAAPNLVASRIVVTFGPPDTITARVGNGGGALAQSGIDVAFYASSPSIGGMLLGVATTSSFLEPGAFEDVSIVVTGGAPTNVWVSVDDDGTLAGVETECNEGDNVYSYGRATAYCTTSTTTNGCTPDIAASANPSASFANACSIVAYDVEGQRTGLVFYGIDNTGFSGAPWGPGSTSWRCVKQPVQRTPAQNSGGSGDSCTGTITLNWNSYQSSHPTALGSPWSAGSDVFAQAWFRDPGAPQTTNLSDAVRLLYQP